MAYEEENHVRVGGDVDETDQHMSAGRYLATRLTTLKPPMEKVANPFTLLAMLNLQQWLFFLVLLSFTLPSSLPVSHSLTRPIPVRLHCLDMGCL
jgi:hypothetical protein